MTGITHLLSVTLQGGLIPSGTRVDVFQTIFWAFLAMGTLVGVVVVGYMLYNAWKYRDHEGRGEDNVDRPELGEIPQGGGKGRKLFLSFGLSAIIVISLIVWTYGTLLYVENDSPVDNNQEEAITVEVTGEQFRWNFEYPGGYDEYGTLRVPADTPVRVRVTSDDVFHNFGVPSLRVKSDAIPGEFTESWFVAEDTGTYRAACYELCGAAHSQMNAEVVVMEPDEFQSWLDEQNGNTTAANASATPKIAHP